MGFTQRRQAIAGALALISVLPAGSALAEGCEVPFLRGDANSDGSVDLSDAVTILFYLFGGLGQTACADALDADDSGSLDLTDAIRILTFIFLEGKALPAPSPAECGLDPTDDALTCAAYKPCGGVPKCATGDCCPKGSYCKKDEGDCDGMGTCTQRPQFCPDVYKPVCGCDGRTYGNSCAAASAGVSVMSQGECP